MGGTEKVRLDWVKKEKSGTVNVYVIGPNGVEDAPAYIARRFGGSGAGGQGARAHEQGAGARAAGEAATWPGASSTGSGAAEHAGDGAVGAVDLAKASVQGASTGKGVRYVEPRVAFEDLLLFFEYNTWLRRATVVKALLTSLLGWRLHQGEKLLYDSVRPDGSELRRADDHPALRLLLRPNPDPTEPIGELLYRLSLDYWLLGNAWLEIARDRRGRVAELYHVPARTMRRLKTASRARSAYVQVVDGRETGAVFPAFGAIHRETTAERERRRMLLAARAGERGINEVLHIFQYDPCGDYYGMPDWWAGMAAMGLDRSILEFNTQLFRNALLAHKAIVVNGGQLTDAGRNAIRQFFYERTMGVENAGRVLLLEELDEGVTIKIEDLNLDLSGPLLTDERDRFRDEIVTATGVPPRLLGIVHSGRLGGSGENEGQMRAFRETVLEPGQQKIELYMDCLLADLCDRAGCEPVQFRLNRFDVTNLASDARFWDRLDRFVLRKVFTPAQARSLIERYLVPQVS